MIITDSIKTTSYKVVLPFYIYAAFAFLLSAILLLTSSSAFTDHYFQPHILAITHLMALGWGTMIILGASHQLVPVLIEGKLYSNALAYTSFILAGIGIPLLVYGFYVFNMHNPAKWGGRFILLSIIAYLINLGVSMSRSKKENIHALFVFTSVLWLFLTGALGLALVYNFTYNMFPHDSLHYLP
ncbi:MAG TPA: cytochrome C oxidase subunit I, partial [Bacteroidia bacterium]|nr:cytochrome C oxidase subunit I [Bacteroidia bacterium]HNF39887.1 cytochrome C oxidase subunit I [Bacteroidia bacterium]HNI29224.1 cytochrome C oxidase subunit I [Bacteroidia bacterium]